MENEVDTDRTMVGEDNSLIIYSANADDTGMYVCKVELIVSSFFLKKDANWSFRIGNVDLKLLNNKFLVETLLTNK